MTIRATAANNNPDVPGSRRQSSPRTARCHASAVHPLRHRTPGPAAAAAQPRAALVLPVPPAQGLLRSLPLRRGAG